MWSFKVHFTIILVLGRLLNHSESPLGSICDDLNRWVRSSSESRDQKQWRITYTYTASIWLSSGESWRFIFLSCSSTFYISFAAFFFFKKTPRLCRVEGDEFLPVVVWIYNEGRTKDKPFVKESVSLKAHIGSWLFLFISVGFTWHLETV